MEGVWLHHGGRVVCLPASVPSTFGLGWKPDPQCFDQILPVDEAQGLSVQPMGKS